MPDLAVMNYSTVITDTEVQAMMPALTQQWNLDLAGVWGLDQVAMTFVPQGQQPTAGSWWLTYVDDATQAGALALHDLTSEGLPIAKVFCRTILNDQASISVAASHELCEMACDPWLNFAAQDSTGRFWALEVADPCEDERYAYQINGVEVTDFVTPAYFGHIDTPKGTPLDFKGHVDRPFEVLTGGYAQWFNPHRGWQQIVGNDLLSVHRIVHPAHGSRRERRERQYEGRLRRSAPRLHP